MVILDAGNPVDDAFRAAVGAVLEEFLRGRRGVLTGIGPALDPFLDKAVPFATGGKRLRPAFCAWAWAACADTTALPDAVVRAAAALDLLHLSALIHDDVMDASDTRRGLPAAHRQFEAEHRGAGARGSAEAFGHAAAILLGDLLLVWSEEMFSRSGLPADAQRRADPYLQSMRTEVIAGQYLDVLAQALDPRTLSRTREGLAGLVELVGRVVTYKSACYTVQRPLNIGAALAGASARQQESFNAFGLPLGRAFQYRDDLLGVFGDEHLTGKQRGEDLREGKLTLLVAQAFGHAGDAAARELGGLFGRADMDASQVDRARDIIAESGAQTRVERAIEQEYGRALEALRDAPLTDDGLRGLTALAGAAVRRSF